MSAASAGFFKTIERESRLVESRFCLTGLSSTLSDLIELVGAGSILHETTFDLAFSFFAWSLKRAIDLASVSSITIVTIGFCVGYRVWIFLSRLCSCLCRWS